MTSYYYKKHSTPQDENIWKKEWEGPVFFSSLNNHKYGVAILCTNNQKKLKASDENANKPGHLSIKIEVESSSFIITNIYAPKIPKKREKIFQNFETFITNNNNNILGGDLNMVENIQKARAGGNPTTQHYGLE